MKVHITANKPSEEAVKNFNTLFNAIISNKQKRSLCEPAIGVMSVK